MARRMTAGSHLLESSASWRRLVTTAVLALVVVAVGGLLLRGAGAVEMPLSEAVNRLHMGVVAELGDLLYRWAGPVPAIVATVLVTAVVLIVSRDLRVASTFAVTIAVTWLSMALVKLAVDRPRPDASLLSSPYQPLQHDASFPSGHAAFLTIFAVTLVALIHRRDLRILAAVAAVLLVGGALLLLTIDGVHYPTDVTASVLWALAVGPLVRAVWVRIVLPRVPGLRAERPGRGTARHRLA